MQLGQQDLTRIKKTNLVGVAFYFGGFGRSQTCVLGTGPDDEGSGELLSKVFVWVHKMAKDHGGKLETSSIEFTHEQVALLRLFVTVVC